MSRPRAAWTPPTRDGVSASRVAVTSGPWSRLTDFLAQRMPAVSDWPERLARGEVLSATGQAMAVDSTCVPGAVLWYWRSLPPESRVPFEIEVLHQDEQLVVVDKPHFLSVTPGGRYLQETVLVRLKRLLGIDTLVPLHRLDRETAGVLLFSVQPGTRHAYHQLLRDRQLLKVYEAIAPWRADLALPLSCHNRLQEPPGRDFMQMQVVAGPPNARTHIELIKRLGALGPQAPPADPLKPPAAPSPPIEIAHYRLLPDTGRKHQLRVHLCELGLPIVGDRIYPRLWPDLAPGAAPDYKAPLQLLARSLSFIDPLTGRLRHFASRRQLQLGVAKGVSDSAHPCAQGPG